MKRVMEGRKEGRQVGGWFWQVNASSSQVTGRPSNCEHHCDKEGDEID